MSGAGVRVVTCDMCVATGGARVVTGGACVQVVAQLLGQAKLPWETMTAEDRHKLGAFRKPILALLNRDPAKRPTMPDFYNNCNAIFSTSTTYTPGNAAMAHGQRGQGGDTESTDAEVMTVASGTDMMGSTMHGSTVHAGSTQGATTSPGDTFAGTVQESYLPERR
jgi:hypothetical protein